MDTSYVMSSYLPDCAGSAQDVAYDVSRRRMALCTPSGSGSIIQVYECSCGPDDWSHVATWATDRQVAYLAWAHNEYGRVLAGGTASGSVLIWGQVLDLQRGGVSGVPGASGVDEEGGISVANYQQLQELICGTAPCRALCFAPRQSGLVFAALFDDGHVVLYEAEQVLAPKSWILHSKIKVGPRGQCGGLCWRPFSQGVPPMLCAGSGPYALVWQYVLGLNSWKIVVRAETNTGNNVATVHWAAPLGRPAELLAVGSGCDLIIYSLSGDTAALQVEQLALLEHNDAVWKVEWDLWGNRVAAATDGQEVHVYTPNLIGQWVKSAGVEGGQLEQD
ncbi:hypothetical protein Vretifemale_3537 [Volvox reticuliferus]|uniref:Uncharacterized protein n=2 Tax=Volvox reticuliferus TaxID=1737510 RepID=A0A8J4C106_9CHLO|nr:hypothetical protein Vretifemale_3537 [Volvox reticuliferus]